MDSARGSLVAACDSEAGGLCAIADESSGISWELTEAALRRLHEEKGEDTMLKGCPIRFRNGRCDQQEARSNARHCVNRVPDEMFGWRQDDKMLGDDCHASTGTDTLQSILKHAGGPN